MPPVAGGAPLFRVVDRPLALDEVVEAVSAPGLGGIVTFTGTVRDALPRPARAAARVRGLRADGGARRSRGLARRSRASTAPPSPSSTGSASLAPGEAAVVIACAAPHRAPAFRACEACIERLKQDVPIWKREVFDDGSEWVGLGP